MPYISNNDDRREQLRNGEPALIAGELNYQIFYYVKHYEFKVFSSPDVNFRKDITRFIRNFLGQNPNYQRYNDMTGVLVRCYKEIYRRLYIDVKYIFEEIIESYDDEIAKYEDTKIAQNGDVK